MTRFAACFILVFGELAWGGLFALAIPPFFNVERGFYKSSASVYLAASITTAVGLGLLALRGGACCRTWRRFVVDGVRAVDAVERRRRRLSLHAVDRERPAAVARLRCSALGLGLVALIANMIS